MDRKNVVCTNTGILISLKEKELLQHVMIWINLEHIMLGEISQSQEGKYYMISLICGI